MVRIRNTTENEIGRILAGRRRAAGFSQSELAERAGVGRNTITDLETGKNPTLETLVRAAQGLDYEVVITLRPIGVVPEDDIRRQVSAVLRLATDLATRLDRQDRHARRDTHILT
jgi:transcriptional regulator with XRE-family HTH domain